MAQILRLKRHDFFEMRAGPRSRFGILEHAAPYRIDQLDRRIEGLPRAFDRYGVAGFGAGYPIVHAVSIDVFLAVAPAADLVLVGFIVILDEPGALLSRQKRRSGRLDFERLPDGRARGRIVDHGLEQGPHPRGLDVSPDLGDLGAVGTEHDGRRPTPIPVSARQVRVGVLIDADRQISRCQKPGDLRVRIGGLFHDVAPVAPYRFEIEDDEALLGCGAGEQIVAPIVPLDRFSGKRR